MTDVVNQIESIDWQSVNDKLNRAGYAQIPGFLNTAQCDSLIDLFDHQAGFRKTVMMERYGFGLGCDKYWDYPLPDLVQD